MSAFAGLRNGSVISVTSRPKSLFLIIVLDEHCKPPQKFNRTFSHTQESPYGREHRTSYFPCLCDKNWFSKELSPFSGVVVIFRILTISWRPIFVAGFQTFAYQPLSSVKLYLILHDQTNPAKERLAWFHLWLVMQCDDDRMAIGDTGLYRKFVESCMACASEHREPLLEIHLGTKRALSRVTQVRKIVRCAYLDFFFLPHHIFSYHIILS